MSQAPPKAGLSWGLMGAIQGIPRRPVVRKDWRGAGKRESAWVWPKPGSASTQWDSRVRLTWQSMPNSSLSYPVF